jgi:predicted lipoprotein with Yx(FWY)xxD motif
MRKGTCAATGLAAIALTAAACGSSSTPSSTSSSHPPKASASSSAPAGATSSGPVLKTAKIHGATVLTNAQGRTLYWFAPDTATTSKCNGTCAKFWPPVKGPVTAGPGVTGKLSTIKRSDGSLQATYNGHPQYTFIEDTAPGQAKGNGLNIDGGVWHETTPSVAMMMSMGSSSSTSGSGGY